MALKPLFSVHQELWENRCETPSPKPVKGYLKEKTTVIINGPSFIYTKTLLENWKTIAESIPIPNIETGTTKPYFETKPKRKCRIGLVPLFNIYPMNEQDPFKSSSYIRTKLPAI